MTKLICGFIKFYIFYMLFGVFAIIILYASADLRCIIDNEGSFLWLLLRYPEHVDDLTALRAIWHYFEIAFDSVPGETFLNALLGVSFDSNVVPDIASAMLDLFQSEKAISKFAETIGSYELFWRDMAVATCASMVLYAVVHLKKQLAGKDFSAQVGVALASVFWILAAYTFGETLTCALEIRTLAGKTDALYIIITVSAIMLEAFIHAYGGRCSPIRLIALLCSKIFFNLIRSFFVLFACKVLISLLDVTNAEYIVKIPLNIFAMTISAAIVLCVSLVESKITDWAERILH